MRNDGLEKSLNHPGVPLAAKVVCNYLGGEEVKLLSTELTLEGAFILAMKPPPLGEIISVTIYPAGMEPLPTLVARVISTCIDPANAARSGFEIVFLHLDDIILRRLSQAVDLFGKRVVAPRQRPIRPGEERRQYPRVPADLKANVEFRSGMTDALSVGNISMSGAKLVYRDRVVPAVLTPGNEIVATFICGSIPESLVVKAKVVRKAGPDETPGVGICFIDLDDLSERRIEGLILEAITNGSALDQ